MFPTKKQWNKWSLPTKAGYCSVWIGVIGMLIGIIVAIILHILSNQQTQENQLKLEMFEKKLEAANYELFNGEIVNPPALDELIKLFNLRASIINEELRKHYNYTEVKSYLNEFNVFHIKHIEALQNHEFILAHEYLTRIYNISYALSNAEFWTRHEIETPDVSYMLSKDAFTKGELICGYLVGDIISYSKKIDLVYELVDFEMYRWIIKDEQFEKEEHSKRNVLAMYELILRNCKK